MNWWGTDAGRQRGGGGWSGGRERKGLSPHFKISSSKSQPLISALV